MDKLNMDVSLDDVADSAAFMLSPLVNMYKQNIDKMLHPFGISAGQPPLLLLLKEKDGQLQKDLARKLGVRASSLTGMLTRLEKNRLIERRRVDDDRRACRVFLTDKGRRVCKKMQAVVRFINERNLAGFRSEEKILLVRLMEHMMTNMNRQHEELLLIRRDENERKKGKNEAAKQK